MIANILDGSKRPLDYKEFVVDDVEEIQLLPRSVGQGSTALVISNGDIYILNGRKEWVKL